MNIRYAFILFVLFASPAIAFQDDAGSCLLFPYYDTGLGLDIFSITNTGTESEEVRLVFVDRFQCAPEEVDFKLTAFDTLTFVVSAIVGQGRSGFMYAYVIDPITKLEKHADVLIGQEIVLEKAWYPSILLVNFTINAVSFRGIEVNPDGLLRLDGMEYELAPRTVQFPRFFGQYPAGPDNFFESRVVLINLTGGMHFEARCKVLTYNDNEQPFQSETDWGCFDVQSLDAVSGGSSKNAYLLSTAHDPAEPYGLGALVETGWMSIEGVEATNFANGVVIENASIYAVLIERFAFAGYGADLPFRTFDENVYINGALWSTDPNGN